VTLAIAITIYSGIDYTLAAARVLRSEGAE
jgi:hypothetical protein